MLNNITAPLSFPAGSYHSNQVAAASNLNYFTTYDGFKLTGFGATPVAERAATPT